MATENRKPSDFYQFALGKLAVVEWHITNFCNFKCSYCHEGLNSGTSPEPTLELALAVVDQLVESVNVPVKINLSGGEPTTWKPLIEFLKQSTKLKAVAITTNGSRGTDWWENELLPNLRGKVTMSFHPEFALRERFVANARLAMAAEKLGKINLPMSPAHWDDCRAVYDSCIEAGLPVVAKPVFEDFGFRNGVVEINKLVEYTTEQQQWLQDIANSNEEVKFTKAKLTTGETIMVSPHELLAQGAVDFRGWKCGAGHRRLLLTTQGSVLPGLCRVEKSYGNIYSDGPEAARFKPDMLTCTVKSCHCPAEVILFKTAPGYVPPANRVLRKK